MLQLVLFSLGNVACDGQKAFLISDRAQFKVHLNPKYVAGFGFGLPFKDLGLPFRRLCDPC